VQLTDESGGRRALNYESTSRPTRGPDDLLSALAGDNCARVDSRPIGFLGTG
jgi:hypothetical protein